MTATPTPTPPQTAQGIEVAIRAKLDDGEFASEIAASLDIAHSAVMALVIEEKAKICGACRGKGSSLNPKPCKLCSSTGKGTAHPYKPHVAVVCHRCQGSGKVETVCGACLGRGAILPAPPAAS